MDTQLHQLFGWPSLYGKRTIIRSWSTRSFWATDGKQKWAVFFFNLSSHYLIYIVKYIFTRKYFENIGEATVLACQIFTSGFLPWLIVSVSWQCDSHGQLFRHDSVLILLTQENSYLVRSSLQLWLEIFSSPYKIGWLFAVILNSTFYSSVISFFDYILIYSSLWLLFDWQKLW